MLREEIKIFFTAILFYTRIPCPSWVDHSDDYLNKATRYFPLIGWIVGLFSATILYLTVLILPFPIAVLASMLSSILLTGAFHEDGWTDVCDGFGGGWTKEKILDIMKDSRVGTYGVTGLFFILMIKYLSISSLLQTDLLLVCKTIVAAHACSRFFAILLRVNLHYVRENDNSKAKPIAKQTSIKDYIIAALFGIAPLLLFNSFYILFAIVPMLITILYLHYYFKKWIGGYTGDCLGAAQQIMEVLFYLAVIVIWKFI